MANDNATVPQGANNKVKTHDSEKGKSILQGITENTEQFARIRYVNAGPALVCASIAKSMEENITREREIVDNRASGGAYYSFNDSMKDYASYEQSTYARYGNLPEVAEHLTDAEGFGLGLKLIGSSLQWATDEWMTGPKSVINGSLATIFTPVVEPIGQAINYVAGDRIKAYQGLKSDLPPGMQYLAGIGGSGVEFAVTGGALSLAGAAFKATGTLGGKFLKPTIGAVDSALTGKLVDKLPPGSHTAIDRAIKPNITKLPEDIIETFAGGRYSSRILDKDMVLYRAGSSEFELGSYFSKDKPKSVIQVRIDKALPTIWEKTGGKSIIDTVYTFKVPAGTLVHTGKISSQGKHFVGGTQQVIVEPHFRNKLQLLKKEPLK